MARSKASVPGVNQALKEIKSGELKPLYYFFGEDSYSIENAIHLIEEKAKPFIASEFDKEVFYGEDKNLSDVLDFASAFPFGSEKKLIIFKEFEKVRDKKKLGSYAESPSDFTIMAVHHAGSVTVSESGLYKTMLDNGYLFEAKELKGRNLIDWLIEYTESKGRHLSRENAQLLVDIAGESRSLLETQLEKIITFLGDAQEITLESIRDLSTQLKEFTIFDLQNALAKKDKAESLKVAFNLLEKGSEPTFIIYMLTRYFTGLSRINELKEKKTPDQAAARIVGTHPYYYKDYLKARTLFSDKELINTVRALLNADLTIKTTSTDGKTVISILIGEILK